MKVRKGTSGLPVVLRNLWFEVVALTLLSVLFSLWERHIHAPLSEYRAFSPPEIRFSDFTIYQTKFQTLFHTERFFHEYFPFTYPAPVAMVYEGFVRAFPRHAKQAFLVSSAAALVLPWGLIPVALRRRGIASWTAWMFPLSLLLCSWPAALILDRGNMEVCVWLALVTATWSFTQGHLKAAAVCFGIAGALKLFPLVLLGLFVSMRRWRELALGIGAFIIVSVLSLAILGPTISLAYHGIATGLQFFQHQYMERWLWWENGVDHSLFGLLKYMLIVVRHHGTSNPFAGPLRAYTLITAIGGCVLYFWQIQFLPLLNQLLILCIVSIYFTSFSGDGTLIHLYCPLVLLMLLAIDTKRRGVSLPGLDTALYLLAFVVSYEGFLVHGGGRREGQVKAIALGWLLVVALRNRFGPHPSGTDPVEGQMQIEQTPLATV